MAVNNHLRVLGWLALLLLCSSCCSPQRTGMNQRWEDVNHVFCDKACISHRVTTLKQNDVSRAASNGFSLLTGASMLIGLFRKWWDKKGACVSGKQGQLAILVELDHKTFFPGIFLRLKIEQTQERLHIYVDEKVLLSCSRISMKTTQAGCNSPDKAIYNGIKVLNFVGIEFSVCARDFLTSSCKTEHWRLFRIIALVWQLLLGFHTFKFWVLKKVVLQTPKRAQILKSFCVDTANLWLKSCGWNLQ